MATCIIIGNAHRVSKGERLPSLYAALGPAHG